MEDSKHYVTIVNIQIKLNCSPQPVSFVVNTIKFSLQYNNSVFSPGLFCPMETTCRVHLRGMVLIIKLIKVLTLIIIRRQLVLNLV